MQTNLEQAIEIIRALPVEDYGKLREIIDEQEQIKHSEPMMKTEIEKDLTRNRKTERWLAENREKYLNQWICLDGGKLIAHGSDGREVFRQAKEKGIEVPFMHHLVEESDWGGW